MLVMNKQRNLSVSTAKRVAKAMKLSGPEAEYFLSLVNLDNVRTPEDALQFEKNRKMAIMKIVSKDIPSYSSERRVFRHRCRR
jgi:hypothetical protein